MKRILCLSFWLLASVLPAAAQEDEQEHLRRVIGEASGSPVDQVRAIEEHLLKFPKSARRPELERALVQASFEAKDEERVVRHGERLLARDQDDPAVLERVSRALLASDSKEQAERALKHATHLEAVLRRLEQQPLAANVSRALLREQIDQGVAKAVVLQARAAGNLGRVDEAVAQARRSFAAYPTAEAAREAGRWLAQQGKFLEAARSYGEAFVIHDPNRTEEHRAKDRSLISELLQKADGNRNAGNDLVLEAYDRVAASQAAYRKALREVDPNYEITNPMKFTLSGQDGKRLEMASLLGKVVVVDFWATWCAPCRIQQPLYEEVEKRYRDRPNVVFLNVSTDEDREVVQPFLAKNGWKKTIYFEDGLSRLLKITSIPTTIVFNARGEISSRMNGFLPERFVEMLSERLDRALRE